MLYNDSNSQPACLPQMLSYSAQSQRAKQLRSHNAEQNGVRYLKNKIKFTSMYTIKCKGRDCLTPGEKQPRVHKRNDGFSLAIDFYVTY